VIERVHVCFIAILDCRWFSKSISHLLTLLQISHVDTRLAEYTEPFDAKIRATRAW
jgi:hypothetical protein